MGTNFGIFAFLQISGFSDFADFGEFRVVNFCREFPEKTVLWFIFCGFFPVFQGGYFCVFLGGEISGVSGTPHFGRILGGVGGRP